MKAGWQTKTLGNICDILDNRRKPITKCDRKPGPYPYYGATGILDYVDGYLFDEPLILVGEDGAKWASGDNTAFAVEGKCWVNNHAHVLRPHRSVLLDNWLIHFLVHSDLSEFVSGLTVPKLNQGNLREITLPVPSLPEQQRIVKLLDEAFEGIATAKANAEKNLQNARAIFNSHLESVLRSKKWTWTTLGELCEGLEYGTSAKSAREGRVPVLRMGNIHDGQLDWESLVYTDDEDEIGKYLLRHNDVLFNRTNSPALVGKSAIYKSEMPAIFAGYLIRIRRNEYLLDGDFLNYFLNSQIALDYGKTVVISSVNQANINGTKLKGYPIPAPSLQDQKIIVKKLDDLHDETQRLETIYQQKLNTLDDLKKSLLHRAFNGNL
jgi:type I restriction enzyme S subunit